MIILIVLFYSDSAQHCFIYYSKAELLKTSSSLVTIKT